MKSSCASYDSRTHDVIDEVSMSQSRSNFEVAISPSIFHLERRPVLNISEILRDILLTYSTSGITAGEKVLSRPQNGGYFENFEILNTDSINLRYEKIIPNYAKKSIFRGDDVIDDVTG